MGAELFKNIYLFKDLSSRELEALSALSSVETFNPGDEIFSEGDQAVSLFVIKFGTVRIRRTGKDNTIDVRSLGRVHILARWLSSTASHVLPLWKQWNEVR